MLGLPHIGTNSFKAHSVRTASSSEAVSAGVETNLIMEVADGSSESAFL